MLSKWSENKKSDLEIRILATNLLLSLEKCLYGAFKPETFQKQKHLRMFVKELRNFFFCVKKQLTGKTENEVQIKDLFSIRKLPKNEQRRASELRKEYVKISGDQKLHNSHTKIFSLMDAFSFDIIKWISIPSFGSDTEPIPSFGSATKKEKKMVGVKHHFGSLLGEMYSEANHIRSFHCAILARDERKILFDFRNKEPLFGCYDFFGGVCSITDIVRSDSTSRNDLILDPFVINVLQRELREELGIEIQRKVLQRHLLKEKIPRIVFSPERNEIFHDEIYCLDFERFAVELSRESFDYEWVNIDESKEEFERKLNEQYRPMHPQVKEAAMKFCEILWRNI
jgi:8-oxo-dGTP pyrophosphatase MutT (NUDIX family)